MTQKRPTDYGAIALQVIGKVALEGGTRETLIAKRANGSAHICALLLQDARSGHARHAVNITGTALDRLKYAGLLGVNWHESQPRYDAGERFGAAWYNGGRAPHLGMRYQHARVGKGKMSPRQQRYYDVWRRACGALGAVLVGPVVACCCFDEVPAESELPRLLTGLDLLSRLPFEFWG